MGFEIGNLKFKLKSSHLSKLNCEGVVEMSSTRPCAAGGRERRGAAGPPSEGSTTRRTSSGLSDSTIARGPRSVTDAAGGTKAAPEGVRTPEELIERFIDHGELCIAAIAAADSAA